jgi:hypothetical protein
VPTPDRWETEKIRLPCPESICDCAEQVVRSNKGTEIGVLDAIEIGATEMNPGSNGVVGVLGAPVRGEG